MDFSRRKLPKEAAEKMRKCRIETIQPFAFVLAPLYAYMKMNEKFVAVKAPLDFFTPSELEKLKAFEGLFFPEFIDSVLPVQEAAKRVVNILQWKPEFEWNLAGEQRSLLPPAPYEIADTVLRIMAPLWGKSIAIEPYFVAVFVNELCDVLPGDLLLQARENDVACFETAVFGSSWAVFLALHLGYCELGFLNRIRMQVFAEISKGIHPDCDYKILSELLAAARELLAAGEPGKAISGELFKTMPSRIGQKLFSRIERLRLSLVSPSAQDVSIFGERGFVDV